MTLLASTLHIAIAAAGTDDYPAKWRDPPQDSVNDSWGYPNRECTSFVAWRLSSRNHYAMPHGIGNANTWDDYFRARGVRVDSVPAVGAIAQSDDGPLGHVAWVEAVQGNTVTLEDYNYPEDVGPDGQFINGVYHERTVLTSRYVYIHVKDLPPPSPPTTTRPTPTTSPRATPTTARPRTGLGSGTTPSSGSTTGNTATNTAGAGRSSSGTGGPSAAIGSTLGAASAIPTPSTTAPPAMTQLPSLFTGVPIWGLDTAGFVSTAGNAVVLAGAPNAVGPVLAGGTDAASLTGTATGRGYWVVDARGTVYGFGAARSFGSLDGARLGYTERAVAIIRTPTDAGYWIVTNTGRVVAFGDAPMLGDPTALPLNAPIVAAAGTPSGKGYVLVAADGGVMAFGDAPFLGSMGSSRPNQPIVAAAMTASGRGYWLVAGDGEVFAFGDAAFRGSLASQHTVPAITAMGRSSDGYVIGAGDGSVFDFTTAPYRRTSLVTTPGHAIVALWVPAT